MCNEGYLPWYILYSVFCIATFIFRIAEFKESYERSILRAAFFPLVLILMPIIALYKSIKNDISKIENVLQQQNENFYYATKEIKERLIKLEGKKK